jgi:hypothetical protein
MPLLQQQQQQQQQQQWRQQQQQQQQQQLTSFLQMEWQLGRWSWGHSAMLQVVCLQQ